MKRIIVLAIAVLTAACSGPEASPSQAVAQPSVPEIGPTDSIVEADPGFVGVVLPAASVDVAPGFEGKVDRLAVVVGQEVALGETLATFDPAAAEEELKIALAELTMAKGQASEAAASARHSARKLRTDRELYAQGYVAEDNVSDAAAERARAGASTTSAAGRIAAAKARIEQLERQLEETSLLAPFAGTVAIVYLDAGELAGTRKPVLRLISTDGAFVRFAVPPSQIGSLALGSVVKVALEDEAVEVSATVREIAPEVDAPTGLVFVEAAVTDADAEKVRPNSKAWVRAS